MNAKRRSHMTADDRSTAIINTIELCKMLMQDLHESVDEDLREDAKRAKENGYRYKMPMVEARKEQIRYLRAKLSKLSKLLSEGATSK